MKIINLLFTFLFCVILSSCGGSNAGIDCDDKNVPGAEISDLMLNGTVMQIVNGDTSALEGASVVIWYANGFDTDCGIHYQERDTLKTNEAGVFNHGKNAFDACGYGYSISKTGYLTLEESFDITEDSKGLCASSIDDTVFYLIKN